LPHVQKLFTVVQNGCKSFSMTNQNQSQLTVAAAATLGFCLSSSFSQPVHQIRGCILSIVVACATAMLKTCSLAW